MSLYVRRWLRGAPAFDRAISILAAVGLAIGLVATGARSAVAQDASGAKKIPAPEDIELQTNDGLQMEATYYGSIAGKNAVPIIMLHAFKGSRGDFAGLALAMQAKGCAVIVPDLRGHGKSTSIKRGGDLVPIDQSRLGKADFEAMISQDLEAVKNYLMDRNNAGELNIEKLCVVGNEMGAMLAIKWAEWDWHWQQLPNVKQGEDAKALVLISPPMNFHGVTIADSLARPLLQTDLSLLIISGEKYPKKDEIQRIYKKVSTLRPKPSSDPKEVEEKQDLFNATIEGATLQGPNILNDQTILPRLSLIVGQFIEWRLINKKIPWTDRKPALGQ